MFKLKVNQNQLNAIQKKLNSVVNKISANTKSTALYKYRLEILNQYRETIVSAMGEVRGEEGGSVGLEMLGDFQSVHWEPLTERTLNEKRIASASLYIWEATGDTKRAVRIQSDNGFAGIDGRLNPDELEKALQVEFGGAFSENEKPEWYKRALFTIANQLFRQNREQIKREIARKVVETARQEGWGS